MHPTHCIIHLTEEATKGTYRPAAESKAKQAIQSAISGIEYKSIRRKYQRIFIMVTPETDISKLKEILLTIPSIASFGMATKAPAEKGRDTAQAVLEASDASSFRVKVKISDRQHKRSLDETTQDLSKELAQRTNKTIDFINPKITLYVEILENGWYCYTEQIVSN